MAAVKHYLILGYLWLEWLCLKAGRMADRIAWRRGLKSRWPLVWALLGLLLVLAGGLLVVIARHGV